LQRFLKENSGLEFPGNGKENLTINILEYLEKSAAETPLNVAFADREHELTYARLIRDAKSTGSVIIKLLKGETRKPIGVFIDRDVSCLPVFLGVVYSGNFYVPFDRNLPLPRLIAMVDSIHPVAFLGKISDQQILSDMGYPGDFLDFDQAVSNEISPNELTNIRSKAIDADPMYAIFTSGSTGIPKCVVVSHRSVIDLIERFSTIFKFSSDSVFGNQAPFDFDVSVKDIYSTLKHSARMEIIPKEVFSFPGELIRYLNQREINTLIWSTSALRIIANLKGLEKEIPQYLKWIMFSGEVMPNKVLNYWRRHLPDVRYVNLYGPTEITCNCSYHIVDRDYRDEEALPIGIPFPNTDILILNEHNELAKPGEVGEICVRGTSLALGYYNNPEETQRVFCKDPLNSHYDELIYRTGDLGKQDESGLLFFLSRKDNQIKHMGYRIEMGEIEIAINALELLEAGCCLHDEREDKIVLFYQSPNKNDREILERLKQTLPRYMLPNRLVHMISLPLNKNGKIDRKALKEQYIDAARV
jgi:amino acid adenylation domain-containing protein